MADVGDLRLNCRGADPVQPAAALDVAPLVSHGYTVSAAPRAMHLPCFLGTLSNEEGGSSSSYVSLRIPTRIFTRARGCALCRVGLNTDGLAFTAAYLYYV